MRQKYLSSVTVNRGFCTKHCTFKSVTKLYLNSMRQQIESFRVQTKMKKKEERIRNVKKVRKRE